MECEWCWFLFLVFFFFFKQKTAYEMRISDWSSDVCSSDLGAAEVVELVHEHRAEIDLKHLEHAVRVDAQHLGAHPVDVGIYVRRLGVVEREHADQAGDLVGGADHVLHRRLQNLRSAAALVLDHHLESTGVAEDRQSTRLNSSH